MLCVILNTELKWEFRERHIVLKTEDENPGEVLFMKESDPQAKNCCCMPLIIPLARKKGLG